MLLGKESDNFIKLETLVGIIYSNVVMTNDVDFLL